MSDTVKRAVWTFVQGFLVVFLAGLNDLLDAFKAGGLTAAESALVALVVGAAMAGLSAVKNLLFSQGSTVR